jgi:integrase/recombinase XerD
MTSLRSAVQDCLAVRRGLGFQLRDAGRLLLQFVAFMDARRASHITTPLALAWAQQPQTVQPADWARRLSIVRIFARYCHVMDPRTEIPPDGILPFRPPRARPYLYADDEIERLLRAALTMPVATNAAAYGPGATTVCSDS